MPVDKLIDTADRCNTPPPFLLILGTFTLLTVCDCQQQVEKFDTGLTFGSMTLRRE